VVDSEDTVDDVIDYVNAEMGKKSQVKNGLKEPVQMHTKEGESAAFVFYQTGRRSESFWW